MSTPTPDQTRAPIERHMAAWNARFGEKVAWSYGADARFVINRAIP